MLEVGGGLGVLSEYLAPRVAHLHVVEVDRAPRAARSTTRSRRSRTRPCTWPTRVELDFGGARPAPDKVVANLPYGVAATVLLKSIEELPEASLWVAMVQREVGERLAAAPGIKAYGATSVLAQLSCEVRVLRRVPRTVFHPVPNVDSALVVAAPHRAVAAGRRGRAGACRRSPTGARRWPARSRWRPARPADIRDAARAALERIGHPADARAERLDAADFAGSLKRSAGERLRRPAAR